MVEPWDWKRLIKVIRCEAGEKEIEEMNLEKDSKQDLVIVSAGSFWQGVNEFRSVSQ